MPKINKKPYGLTWIFLLIILISCSKKISPPKPEKYLAFKNFPLKAGPEDLKSEACLRLKKEPYLSIRRFAEEPHARKSLKNGFVAMQKA